MVELNEGWFVVITDPLMVAHDYSLPWTQICFSQDDRGRRAGLRLGLGILGILIFIMLLCHPAKTQIRRLDVCD